MREPRFAVKDIRKQRTGYTCPNCGEYSHTEEQYRQHRAMKQHPIRTERVARTWAAPWMKGEANGR